MIYVTGDTHGSYSRLRKFCRNHPELGRDDLIVIVGDTGLNYHGDERDLPHKDSAARVPTTLLCLHGNHDRRPESMTQYRRDTRFGGTVFVEEAYPNILFAMDGEIYDLEGTRTLAIGGAYSVDKDYRLENGFNWFADEQISDEMMARVEERLEAIDWDVDCVLTHTCPLRYEPSEAFFASIDQATVDRRMERWLDEIEARLRYRRWFCGHFHIDKRVDRLRFLFRDTVALHMPADTLA